MAVGLTGSSFLNQTASNNIYWVDSDQQAKSYPVAFGASVCMLDRNADFMYIKSVDQSGVMTGFRKFKLEEVIDMPAGDYVSKSEYDELKNQLDQMKSQIENMQTPRYNNNYKNNRRSS